MRPIQVIFSLFKIFDYVIYCIDIIAKDRTQFSFSIIFLISI